MEHSISDIDAFNSGFTTLRFLVRFNVDDTEINLYVLLQVIAQSAGAVEYTGCFSAEGEEPPTKCPGYDTKQSDGEVPAMLELWGMRSTLSLPSLPGPLWPRVVAPDMALSMGLEVPVV